MPRLSTPPSTTPTKLRRVQTLSHLLDDAITIPGLNYSIGLDPIIGLIPAGGDIFTGFLSVYIMIEAFRLGASASTLARMAINILLEVFAGMIPVLGDLFDVAWKANARNVTLLEDHLQSPQPRRQADRIFFGVLVTAMLAIILCLAILSFLFIRFIFQLAGSLFLF